MWTDGRYFLQASQQMDNNWTLMKMGEVVLPGFFLPEESANGSFRPKRRSVFRVQG